MLQTMAVERGMPVGALVAELAQAMWASLGRDGEPQPLPRRDPEPRKTPRRPKYTMNGQPLEQASPTLVQPTDADGRGTHLW